MMKDHLFSFNETYELTMKSIKLVHLIETKRIELHLHNRDIVVIRDSF